METGEDIARKLPHGRLLQLPDCGILAALEVPDLLAAVLTTELESDFRLEGAA